MPTQLTQPARCDSLADTVEENELALFAARRRYREGVIDFLNVLSVQNSLLDSRNAAIRNNMAASVNLIRLWQSACT